MGGIDAPEYVESGTGDIDLHLKQFIFVPQFVCLFESWTDWVEIAVQSCVQAPIRDAER